MRAALIPDYITENHYETLRTGVPWVNRESPRDECFMALADAPQTYSYGNDNDNRRDLHTYRAVPMHPCVEAILHQLNSAFDARYNVCVLNYYKDQHQCLGWHADDSPEQDPDHPIAVIAFGAARYIFTKKKDAKGAVPPEDRYLMTPGALFVMPGGYQNEHAHRIPKHDRPCGGRISLTFRRLVR